MTALTAWWYCEKCGYANKPRLGKDPATCEQCGDNRDKQPASIDYKPAGAN